MASIYSPSRRHWCRPQFTPDWPLNTPRKIKMTTNIIPWPRDRGLCPAHPSIIHNSAYHHGYWLKTNCHTNFFFCSSKKKQAVKTHTKYSPIGLQLTVELNCFAFCFRILYTLTGNRKSSNLFCCCLYFLSRDFFGWFQFIAHWTEQRLIGLCSLAVEFTFRNWIFYRKSKAIMVTF